MHQCLSIKCASLDAHLHKLPSSICSPTISLCARPRPHARGLRSAQPQTKRRRCCVAVFSRAVAQSSNGLGAATGGRDRFAEFASQQSWLTQDSKLPTLLVEPKKFKGDDAAGRVGFIATRDIEQGQAVLVVPESLAVTSVDAEKHPIVGPVAVENGELIGLTLWLMAENAAGGASNWAPLLATLPDATTSPLLWSDNEVDELLAGSPIQAEVRARKAALRAQWEALSSVWLSKDPDTFLAATFNEANFLRSFSVVLAHALYLPSADCFALLPIASALGRTGNGNGCDLDYDAATGTVVVTAGRPYRDGAEVLLNDQRPSGELLVSTGTLQDDNAADFLMFPASLISGDKYYNMKESVLAQLGFGARDDFPVYKDRMPNQLLAYLRLARINDPAMLAKVSFTEDVVISQMNEYEVLQLLMGDCRERLAAYKLSYEEDTKLLQQRELVGKQRLAARLRLSEKRILTATMEAVRRRLAPIRGIPTKSGGMSDPNADIREVFEFIEALPSAPKKLFDGLAAWARGDFDPDWKPDPKKTKNLPPR